MLTHETRVKIAGLEAQNSFLLTMLTGTGWLIATTPFWSVLLVTLASFWAGVTIYNIWSLVRAVVAKKRYEEIMDQVRATEFVTRLKDAMEERRKVKEGEL